MLLIAPRPKGAGSLSCRPLLRLRSSEEFGTLCHGATTLTFSDIGKKATHSHTATADLQKELLKTWVNSLFLNFPVLGVRFSIYDAWIIGSFALIVLAAWEFFALRRENDLIARLLQDASQQNQSTKCFVYHGILGTQLFATISDSSEPIRSIHSPGCTSNGSLSIARWVPRFIMNLPATTIACILISDIVTLLYPAPFRRSHRALWEAMAPIELFFTLVEEIGVFSLV